jgi:uncharacterized membrane protein YkgB
MSTGVIIMIITIFVVNTFPSRRVGWSKNAATLLPVLVSVSFIGVTPSIVMQYASRPSRQYRHCLIAQKITRCNEVTIQAQKQKPPTGKK